MNYLEFEKNLSNSIILMMHGKQKFEKQILDSHMRNDMPIFQSIRLNVLAMIEKTNSLPDICLYTEKPLFLRGSFSRFC